MHLVACNRIEKCPCYCRPYPFLAWLWCNLRSHFSVIAFIASVSLQIMPLKATRNIFWLCSVEYLVSEHYRAVSVLWATLDSDFYLLCQDILSTVFIVLLVFIVPFEYLCAKYWPTLIASYLQGKVAFLSNGKLCPQAILDFSRTRNLSLALPEDLIKVLNGEAGPCKLANISHTE